MSSLLMWMRQPQQQQQQQQHSRDKKKKKKQWNRNLLKVVFVLTMMWYCCFIFFYFHYNRTTTTSTIPISFLDEQQQQQQQQNYSLVNSSSTSTSTTLTLRHLGNSSNLKVKNEEEEEASLTQEKKRKKNLQLLWTASSRPWSRPYYDYDHNNTGTNEQQQQQQQLQAQQEEPFQLIRLVISHCLHDLFWLSNFTKGYGIHINSNNNGDGTTTTTTTTTKTPSIIEITIISKCGKPVIGAPPMSNVIRLPNLGRCDHSYAYYLSQYTATAEQQQQQQQQQRNRNTNNGNSNSNSNNNNNKKNEAIVFLKDDHDISSIHQSGLYRTLQDMLSIVSLQSGFACGIYPTQRHGMILSSFHQTYDLYQFKIRKYQSQLRKQYNDIGNSSSNSSIDTTNVPFVSKYKNLGDFIMKLSSSSSSNLPITTSTSTSTNDDDGSATTTTTKVLPIPLTEVCYGGIFATTRTNILRTTARIRTLLSTTTSTSSNTTVSSSSSSSSSSFNIWNQLQIKLERGNNIEEGHFIERLWAGLLSTPITKNEINDLLQYSTTVIKVRGSIMGALAIPNEIHQQRQRNNKQQTKPNQQKSTPSIKK